MAEIDTRTAEIGSPEWWLVRLHKRLDARSIDIALLDDYYNGQQQIRYAMERWRKAFSKQFRHFSENAMPLVVDSVEERIDVVGFQVGGEFDKATWALWQRNQMDAESQLAHMESLITAYAYAMVWNEDDAEGRARITVESPYETIVEYASGDRRKRASALKVFRDDSTGRLFATVYLPEGVWKYQSTRPVDEGRRLGAQEVMWETREPAGEDWPLANPFGKVPVVALENRRRLGRAPRSEIADVLTTQDAINKLSMDLLVASEFAAFRQRYLIGVEEPKDPKTGQVVSDYWKQALEAFIIIPNADGRVGSIEATDLTNYVAAIEHEIQQVATRTKTPPHYFFLRGEFPSGESIVAAEAGLVAKARRRMRHWSDAWEEVVSMARQIEGLGSTPAAAIETMWRDPESRTEAQHVDAVGKKRSLLEIPLEQAWEDVGYRPDQIARLREMRARELAGASPSDGAQGGPAG